ncbi:mucin-19 isoform X3 [Scophthalmus maximus]|uniref:mucin-19 isoform X3 n=1 Tax=Scophthalmus maximus TaxID=52904 RepID=UPI001FA91303|nr:mucin-19 isoform X3 [Scophthalmus maximus]
MLPPNLLIVSMIVFLVTTVSTAPVEEKEHEEAEVETTEEGEGELSEEEDDDDSKSQDKSEGILGVQQTAVASASGGSVSSVQSAGGGRDAAAGSDAGPPSSPGSPGSAGSPGSPGSAGSVAAELPGSSSGQTQTAGNAQKLLNGGGGGGADSQTGVFPIFGGGFSHLDYTGIIDTSSHDFLLGLMGTSSGVSADQNTGSSLDLPAGHVHHQTDIGVDQSGGDHSSPSSGPDQSLPGSASGSSHSTTQQEAAAASSSSSVGDAHREQTGNGRQTHLTDETGVTDRPVPLSDLQTDLTGVLSHTDLVTVATDFTVTDTVSADPTGSPAETSHPAVTDHTQAAGSVTEQYNPSGQGPEGAENVELEDSC